jgi:hypothetical protein
MRSLAGFRRGGGARGLHGAGDVDEVRALGVVEAQRACQRVEDAVGGADEIAAFQAAVVGHADARQDGDFLAAQAGHAPDAVVGQPNVGRLSLARRLVRNSRISWRASIASPA